MSQAESEKPVMMRRPVLIVAAAVASAGVLLAAAYFGRPQKPAEQSQGRADPEAALDRRIVTMLDSARQGDVTEYLDCFAGELRRSLEAQFGERPAEQLAGELRRTEATLKNFVTEDCQFRSPDEATLLLSRTYKSHDSTHRERHRVRFRRRRGQWRITEMIPLETVAPRLEYGTPVAPGADGASPTGDGSAETTEDR